MLWKQFPTASRVSNLLRHLSVQGATDTSIIVRPTSAQIPLDTQRPRLCVLGSGWAAARLLRDIDPKKWDLTVLSPRNHMVFTPLLASTTVGTLEFRSVALPIRDIQPALGWPQNSYITADAAAVQPHEKVVDCIAPDQTRFGLQYDQLVIATGAAGSTFGIAGVHEYAHFLRDVKDASRIRSRLIDILAMAGTPGRASQQRADLLHVVIVGGGPTGVEFAGEICDFIDRDIRRLYPDRARDVKVTIVEGREILGSFDVSLREYAARRLTRLGVELYKGVVQEVQADKLMLKDGSSMPFGLCVWSTGVGPTPFIESLPFAKTNVGRLAVNEHMQVLALEGQDMRSPSEASRADIAAQEEASDGKGTKLVPCSGVFALGDCAGDYKLPLPALAQVAEQQGKYVASLLNKLADQRDYTDESIAQLKPFQYHHLGSMASLGHQTAVMQVNKFGSFTGFQAWFAWRSAYLTRLGSLKKRIEVAMDWLLALVFGRDTSRW